MQKFKDHFEFRDVFINFTILYFILFSTLKKGFLK